MAVDMFLKIDGIDGESAREGKEKWIEVLSYSWGLTDTTNATSQPGKLSPATRKTHVSDFLIVKALDTASPALFEKACEGAHIGELNFSLVRAGDLKVGQEFYKIKFEDVLISSVSSAGAAGGSLPMEQVSFSFGSSLITATDDRGNVKSVASCGAASFDGPVLEKR